MIVKLENSVINHNLEKGDKKISFYITFFFIATALNGSIKTIFNLSESGSSILSIFTGFSILFVMLQCLRIVYKRSSIMFLNTILLFIIIYIFSIIQALTLYFPIEYIWKYSAFLQFSWWIPIGLSTYSIYNKEILYNTLLKGSYIISAILSFSFIQYIFGVSLGDTNNYNMFFSYAMLLPILLHINEFFRKKQAFLLIICTIEFIEILLYGARGPLLWILIFILISIVYNKSILKISFVIISLIIGILIYFNWDQIIANIFNILTHYNIKSRTLSLIFSNEIGQHSSRTEIWNICKQLINERPLIGYGLGNEYFAIGNKMISETGSNIVLPHNGLIQLFLNFGILIGGILSLFVLYSFRKVFEISNYFSKSLLFILFVAYILPSITVGDGLLIKPGTAVYFFLLISELIKSKKKYENFDFKTKKASITYYR